MFTDSSQGSSSSSSKPACCKVGKHSLSLVCLSPYEIFVTSYRFVYFTFKDKRSQNEDKFEYSSRNDVCYVFRDEFYIV